MNVDVLVRSLDRLDHTERLTELVAHLRSLAPADARALGRTLFEGDNHRRQLALFVAQLVRDIELGWIALDDPSVSVRATAAKLIGRYAEDIPTSVIDRLDTASFALLLQQLVRRRHRALATTIVDALIERERLHEAAYLLPACGEQAITERLDWVAWPELAWSRLAKHRAALLVAHIERSFASNQERPDLVWRRYGADVWANLAEHQSEALAGWIDRFADAESLPLGLWSALRKLVRWSPAKVVGWLTTRLSWVTQHGLPAGLAARADQVDDDTLAPLCRGLARVAPHLLGLLIARMPYPRRGQLFELAIEPLELARIEWPTSLLAVLPTTLRDREAARMLGLARASTDATWRRELLGLRTIEAARPLLEAEGRSAQASDRAEAHAALIRSTGRSREGMPETLAWLGRTRNEQDPVRLAILGALAQVPGHRFTDAAALDAVVAPIFEARDTSWASRQQAARLAHRLMVSHASEPSSPLFALGLSILERLAGQNGTLDLPQLERNLPRGAEQAIVDALLPWLEAAQKRQQEQHVYRLWTALGKRAWKVAKLDGLLAEMIWHGNKGNAGYAAELWIRDPSTRDARVRELVGRDRSALYLWGVFNHCHRRRQTLLADRLSSPAPRGRFHDGKVVHVPLVAGGFSRWSTELQQRYVQLLRNAEAAPKHYSQTRAALIGMRARVPLTKVGDLQDAIDSSDVVEQEAALAALVWTDEPAPALPILLDHLDGDRARVAMYAMPRLARLIPRERFVDALAELLARPKLKVTVHKEALRLLGQLATPRAIELLRTTWDQPLHRDVRIAALHAARSVLSQPDAWTILASAARDEAPDVARAVVEVPLINIPEQHRQRYARAMAEVADHPSPVARAALFGALCAGWTLADPVASVELAARVIGRLDLVDPWRLAARVLAEGARSSLTHTAIVTLAEQLVGAAAHEVAPAGERDRMAHQRLLGVIEALVGDRHPLAATLLERLATNLLADPRWWRVGARLRIAATPNLALGSVIVELLARAPTQGCTRAVEDAAREAAGLRQPPAAEGLGARDWTAEQAEQVTDLLASGEPAVRIIAVVMLAEFGPRWAWGSTWVSRLHRLREDPDLDVESAARSVWIARA